MTSKWMTKKKLKRAGVGKSKQLMRSSHSKPRTSEFYSTLGHVGRASGPKGMPPNIYSIYPGGRTAVSFCVITGGSNGREFETTDADKTFLGRFIEPAQTEWAVLIVFAQKKVGSVRLCADCRKRNAVTKRNVCVIPRMDYCNDSPTNAAIS